MPGPNAKPTALKLLQGNPGKRPLNLDEPKPPEVARLVVPAHLSTLAKKEFKRTAKVLRPLGVFTEADIQALELYASTYDQWRTALLGIAEHGMVLPGLHGPTVSPHMRVVDETSKRLRSMLIEFGMTPSARSNISVKTSKANDGNPYAPK